MEKYKYCNIGPASSPRVGGREGGREEGTISQEETTHVKTISRDIFLFFFGCDGNALGYILKPRI